MKKIRILAVDTSCDETSAAVTENTNILSNVIWSQASLHAKWGGVVPSVAKREHLERIGWVITKALKKAFPKNNLSDQDLIKKYIDAVAVTVGPGLAIALEVGLNKIKELSKNTHKPLIPVNHIEGHILSPLAKSKIYRNNVKIKFPTLGLVASGGHTEVIYVKSIGDYNIIAQTSDDALGESLDKAARLLGFGYPGGEILEKVAKEGKPGIFKLPIPMIGREKEMYFSYSGLKTALIRLLKEIQEKRNLSKNDISDLALTYQTVAFTHFTRVLDYILKNKQLPVKNILAGGGVMSNVTLRKMIRQLTKKYDVNVNFPYSKKLYTDNAAMIGLAAYFRYRSGEYIPSDNLDYIDRIPRAKVDKPFLWS